MTNRFANLFGLTEDQAIALLDTPLDQLSEDDSRYVAAAQLAFFPSEKSVQALLRAVQNTDSSLDNRIVRRKAVESLGKLLVVESLPVIRTCLADDDNYLVENTVWAIGEIGTHHPGSVDATILEDMAQLLAKPGQTYRVLIHTLANLDYQPALDRIRPFVESTDEPTASAAASAVCRFTGDYTLIDTVVAFLHHANVYARRLCIQDLIDAKYYPAIPKIVQCPVSVVFRLRGIRLLAESGVPAGAIAFSDLEPSLDLAIADHPHTLEMVHAYDQAPSLPFLIRELYETDFGRCYLATQTILEQYPQEAGAALMATYTEEAASDYGAHYHVLKLWGWLKYAPAYDLILESLHNPQPQYQKSRMAAAIALAQFGDPRAIPDLKTALSTRIWDLKYAALLALHHLGDTTGVAFALQDEDWLIQAKAKSLGAVKC